MYEWIGRWTGNERVLRRLSRLSGLLPRGIAMLGCRLLALLLYIAAGSGLRTTIARNMRELLPALSETEIGRKRYRFYENLVVAIYEILLESYRLEGSEAWRFQVEGEAHLEEVLRLGRGAIVYTPHVGNFFYYYWYLCRKYNCLTVATAGSSELLPLYKRFESLGCPGLDYDSTPPVELIRRLRAHLKEGGVVFLLGDFWRPTFPQSRFFGRISRLPEGASTLAIDQQVPIVPFSGWRERGFIHRMRFEAPLHLSSSFTRATRTEATNVLNRFMEGVIRERPEFWFYWFNAEERWEREPVAAAGKAATRHTHSA